MAGGSYVGLDIGSTLMKVAEVRRSAKGLEVIALGLARTPIEAYENSVIVDVAAMSKAVKALLKEAGISTKQCVSSVSGQSAVVVRVIEVPKMNPAELKETMNYEVERHVPFASGGGGVITDYVPIERPEGVADGQNMEVLLAAAQQDIIDRHVEMLFAAGLKPVAIDVEPLAVGRTLLEMGPIDAQQPGHTVAIVNIGAGITDVGVYRDRLLCFSRTLPVGGDNFTRAIADHLRVDLETAEKYKYDIGEVMLDQVGGQQPAYGGDAGFGAGGGPGFHDFSHAQEAVPTVTTDASPSGRTPFVAGGAATPAAPSPPSGRMPFDFSTPGEAPPPPSGFDLGAEPEAPQHDSARMYAPEQPGEGGFFQPPAPPEDAGFYQPAPVQPDQNLPVPAMGGSGDDLRDQVFAAISAVLVDLAQELKRSLDYYRSRTGDAPIHEVLLVGGSAKLRGLASYLESSLDNIPTRIGDPLQNVSVVSKQFSEQKLQEVATLFPVSIGLGARDLMLAPSKARRR
jgi:type IV pilus assembly protein PilM